MGWVDSDTRKGTMQIRTKGLNKLRITLDDSTKAQNVDYVAIDTTSCWSATFNSWGKKSDAPVIGLGGKLYRVVLEEVGRG
jgi:hypothetical protein